MTCTQYCIWSGQRVAEKRASVCVMFSSHSKNHAQKCSNCRYGYSLPPNGVVPEHYVREFYGVHGDRDELPIEKPIYGVE